MNKESYILITIFIAVILIFSYLTILNLKKSNNKQTEIKVGNEAKINSPETRMSEGTVTVETTPKNLASGTKTVIDVKFTTHSGEINYDMVGISRLTDDLGNSYKALSWDGNMGGHHVEGVLTFEKLNLNVQKITLTIPGVDGKDRIFTWQLK